MNKKIKTIIITPDIQPATTYPSVYILHGFSGNPDRTIKQDIPDLVQKAQEYKTIYVLPDGNYSSWYVDSPIVKDSQYQTFIGKELVEFIDKNYPVKAEKNSGEFSAGAWEVTELRILEFYIIKPLEL